MLSSPAATRCVCSVRQPASAAPLSPDRPRRLWRVLRTGRRRSRRTAPKKVPRGTLINRCRRSAQSGASERTQQRADKVAKADPELAKQVAHGEVSLPAAVAKVEGREKPTPENQASHGQRRTRRRNCRRERRAAERIAEIARTLRRRSKTTARWQRFSRQTTGWRQRWRKSNVKAEVASLKEQLCRSDRHEKRSHQIGEVLQGEVRKRWLRDDVQPFSTMRRQYATATFPTPEAISGRGARGVAARGENGHRCQMLMAPPDLGSAFGMDTPIFHDGG